MPQDFDAIRLTNGGPATVPASDGWAWFHIDNGQAGRRWPPRSLTEAIRETSRSVRLLQNGRVGIRAAPHPRTSLHVLGRISTGRDFTSAGSDHLLPARRLRVVSHRQRTGGRPPARPVAHLARQQSGRHRNHDGHPAGKRRHRHAGSARTARCQRQYRGQWRRSAGGLLAPRSSGRPAMRAVEPGNR